jgi:uncharacterized protein (TIGR00255 family)
MLKSMTGYGEATRETAGFVFAVETRSVNNRFLKVSCKVPEEVSFLQNAIEEAIRQKLTRGTINVSVHFQSTDPSALYDIDGRVVEKYLRQLREISSRLGVAGDVSLRDVLTLPGVVRTEDARLPNRDAVQILAVEVVNEALDALLVMRAKEGAVLEDELRVRLSAVRALLLRVRAEAPRAIEEQQQKLEQRIRQILGSRQASLAADDVLKEVALLADRSDVTEEITRLESHIAQFDEALGADGSIGRRLEFIVQEMFREANTIASKSASSRLTEPVLEMKAEVDRLKEQVANIE